MRTARKVNSEGLSLGPGAGAGRWCRGTRGLTLKGKAFRGRGPETARIRGPGPVPAGSQPAELAVSPAGGRLSRPWQPLPAGLTLAFCHFKSIMSVAVVLAGSLHVVLWGFTQMCWLLVSAERVPHWRSPVGGPRAAQVGAAGNNVAPQPERSFCADVSPPLGQCPRAVPVLCCTVSVLSSKALQEAVFLHILQSVG